MHSTNRWQQSAAGGRHGVGRAPARRPISLEQRQSPGHTCTTSTPDPAMHPTESSQESAAGGRTMVAAGGSPRLMPPPIKSSPPGHRSPMSLAMPVRAGDTTGIQFRHEPFPVMQSLTHDAPPRPTSCRITVHRFQMHFTGRLHSPGAYLWDDEAGASGKGDPGMRRPPRMGLTQS